MESFKVPRRTFPVQGLWGLGFELRLYAGRGFEASGLVGPKFIALDGGFGEAPSNS